MKPVSTLAAGLATSLLLSGIASGTVSFTKLDLTLPATVDSFVAVGQKPKRKPPIQPTIIILTDGMMNRVSGPNLTPLTGPGTFDTRLVGAPTTDGTHVIFRGVDPSGAAGPANGIFAIPLAGGTPITLATSTSNDPRSAPVISLNNAVGNGPKILYQNQPGNAPPQLFVTTLGGTPTPVASPPGTTAILGKGIQHWGDRVEVVETTSSAGTSRGIYVQPAATGDSVPIPLNGLVPGASNPTLLDDDARTLFFEATSPATGKSGLYRTKNTTPFTPTPDYNPATLVFEGLDGAALDFSFNTSGQFVAKKSFDYYSALATEATGLVSSGSGSGPSSPTLLFTLGTTMIDGLTITDAMLSPTSMQEDGDVLALLTLSDGSRGMYLIAVPEPTSLGLVAGMMTLLGRRRVRRPTVA